MTKKEIVDNLIACQHNQWTEKDREVLNALPEEHLNKMLFQEGEKSASPPATPAPHPEAAPPVPAPAANSAPKVPDTMLKNSEEYLKSLPPEVQATMQSALNMRKRHVESIVNTLLQVEGNKFTKEELEAMPLDTLERIVELTQHSIEAPAPIYAGNAGAMGLNKGVDADDKPLVAPTMADIFPPRQ